MTRLPARNSDRRPQGNRHKLRARLTDTGHNAFEGHVAVLQAIVTGARPAD